MKKVTSVMVNNFLNKTITSYLKSLNINTLVPMHLNRWVFPCTCTNNRILKKLNKIPPGRILHNTNVAF